MRTDPSTSTLAWPRAARTVARTVALLGLTLLGCAGGGETACRVQVLKLERWQLRPGALDASYRVRGQAGSPAIVSLVARLGPQNYITGPGVEVGPGPFEAIVDLSLTGVPPELLVLLEVGPRRCTAEASKPG